MLKPAEEDRKKSFVDFTGPVKMVYVIFTARSNSKK